VVQYTDSLALWVIIRRYCLMCSSLWELEWGICSSVHPFCNNVRLVLVGLTHEMSYTADSIRDSIRIRIVTPASIRIRFERKRPIRRSLGATECQCWLYKLGTVSRDLQPRALPRTWRRRRQTQWSSLRASSRECERMTFHIYISINQSIDQFIRQQTAKGHLQVAIYNIQWL